MRDKRNFSELLFPENKASLLTQYSEQLDGDGREKVALGISQSRQRRLFSHASTGQFGAYRIDSSSVSSARLLWPTAEPDVSACLLPEQEVNLHKTYSLT